MAELVSLVMSISQFCERIILQPVQQLYASGGRLVYEGNDLTLVAPLWIAMLVFLWWIGNRLTGTRNRYYYHHEASFEQAALELDRHFTYRESKREPMRKRKIKGKGEAPAPCANDDDEDDDDVPVHVMSLADMIATAQRMNQSEAAADQMRAEVASVGAPLSSKKLD